MFLFNAVLKPYKVKMLKVISSHGQNGFHIIHIIIIMLSFTNEVSE